ncbi:MAG: hypothetical protein RLZZ69_1523 [Cyanobacteriota bacterium]
MFVTSCISSFTTRMSLEESFSPSTALNQRALTQSLDFAGPATILVIRSCFKSSHQETWFL